MIATRSQSCSASSMCVRGEHDGHARGRAARGPAPTSSPARAGPCPRSARRGTASLGPPDQREREREALALPAREPAHERAARVPRARRGRAADRGRRGRRSTTRTGAAPRAAGRPGRARPPGASRRCAGAARRRRAHGSRPSTRTVAGVGPAVALEDLDRRRLARAVRAEQAEHLARRDRERDAVDGAVDRRSASRARRPDRPRSSRRHRRVSAIGRGVPADGVAAAASAVAPGDERARARPSAASRVVGDRHRRRARRGSRRRSRSMAASISSHRAGARRAGPGARRSRRRRGRRRRPVRAAAVRRRRRGPTAAASSGVSLPSRRSSPTGLPVTAASPNTPSRSSRIWNASPSGRPKALSGAAQLVEPARERGAEVQRALDRVLARLVPLDRARPAPASRSPLGGAAEVEVLADAQLDAQLVEHAGAASAAIAAEQHVGVDEREVADEDRRALAEAPGLAPPAGGVVRGR